MSVAEVVGWEEKRDGRRDGMARFNFGPCPGGEIENGIVAPVYSTGVCGVIKQYASEGEVLYEWCWRCLTTTARAWLARFVRSLSRSSCRGRAPL